MNKEDVARNIFGIGRTDGCEFNFLTAAQQAAILDTLALTDEVDAVYDRQGGGASFAAAFRKAREKYEEVVGVLPREDIRTALLGTTLKAYQDWGTLIVGSELKHFEDASTPTGAAARVRKAFLQKIMKGELDAEGQDFFNYLLGKGR